MGIDDEMGVPGGSLPPRESLLADASITPGAPDIVSLRGAGGERASTSVLTPDHPLVSAQGVSLKEIAYKLGRPWATLRHWVRRYGIRPIGRSGTLLYRLEDLADLQRRLGGRRILHRKSCTPPTEETLDRLMAVLAVRAEAAGIVFREHMRVPVGREALRSICGIAQERASQAGSVSRANASGGTTRRDPAR